MQNAAALVWCLERVRHIEVSASVGWVKQVVVVLKELAVSGYWKTADGNQPGSIQEAHKCVLLYKIVIPGGAIRQGFVAIGRE